MGFYLAWVPIAIVIYVINAMLSKWANDFPDTWKWVIIIYLMQFVSVWPFVAKFSKNLVFDSFLFDMLIFFSYFVTLLVMGAGSKFTTVQWFGTILLIVGFVILRIGGK
jgi:multidrug transporter EmrE-like cation transporter